MSTMELCRRLNVTPRMVQWWCDQRYLRSVANGHGREFNDTEALVAGIIAELRNRGLPLQRIAQLQLRKPAGDYLVVLGEGAAARWCSAEELIACVAHAPGACLVVSVEELKARLWPQPKTSASQLSAAAPRTR